MKQRLLFLIVVLLAIPMCNYASNPNQSDEPIIIPITPPVSHPSNKPRSLVERDIEATYCAGVLTVMFNENLDDSDVTVANVSTGEVWSNSVNGFGVVNLLLSGDEGYYYITIDTEEGQYTGEFEL